MLQPVLVGKLCKTVTFVLTVEHLFLGGKQTATLERSTTGARPPDLGEIPGVTHDSARLTHTAHNTLRSRKDTPLILSYSQSVSHLSFQSGSLEIRHIRQRSRTVYSHDAARKRASAFRHLAPDRRLRAMPTRRHGGGGGTTSERMVRGRS
jgi:hypothetical protein